MCILSPGGYVCVYMNGCWLALGHPSFSHVRCGVMNLSVRTPTLNLSHSKRVTCISHSVIVSPNLIDWLIDGFPGGFLTSKIYIHCDSKTYTYPKILVLEVWRAFHWCKLDLINKVPQACNLITIITAQNATLPKILKSVALNSSCVTRLIHCQKCKKWHAS